jgi:MFS family permease
MEVLSNGWNRFVTYIASELPSNLVIKKFTPSRWIAFITTSWGIVATLTGIVQDFKGLVACRVILGALEGGLFPGLAIYLTSNFPSFFAAEYRN